MNEPQTTLTWDRFYMQHRHALTAYALTITGNVADAADAIQEAMLRILRTQPRPAGSLPFVLSVIRNLVIDRRRSPAARTTAADSLAETLFDEARAGPDERETLWLLREALDELSPAQREVVVLKVFAEMTFREIAELLESPLGTVASHYARALDRLRARLTNEVPHER